MTPSETAVAEALRALDERHGAVLRPETRLAADLGLGSADAGQLVAALAARFGTDFAPLRAEWPRYFPEGRARRLLFSLPGMLTLAVLVAAAIAWMGGSDWVAALGAGGVIAALIGLEDRLPATRDEITVRDLAAAIDRGRWERQPGGATAR